MIQASARRPASFWLYGLVAAGIVAAVVAVAVARFEGGPPPPSGPSLPAELSANGAGAFEVEVPELTLLVFEIESDGGLLEVGFNRIDLGAAGGRIDVLRHFGAYEDTRMIGVVPGRWEVVVSAEAGWRVAVSQPQLGELPLEIAGEADWASPLLELSNLTEIEINYEGDDEFLIFIFREDGARLYAPIQTVGAFAGPLRFRTAPGKYVIAVETLGPWTLDVLRTYSSVPQ